MTENISYVGRVMVKDSDKKLISCDLYKVGWKDCNGHMRYAYTIKPKPEEIHPLTDVDILNAIKVADPDYVEGT